MIVFDLSCPQGHCFEAWFRSSADYDEQIQHDEVECPICGHTNITKAPMAPNIVAKGNQRSQLSRSKGEEGVLEGSDIDLHEQISVGTKSLPKELQQELEHVLVKVQKHIEENCHYVGEDFAEEARKMHYGEKDKVAIYGEASAQESCDLIDEGIDIMPLPLVRKPGPTDA